MNDYYTLHAREYAEKAMTFDMSDVYDRFLPLVKPCGKVLDIGCGSGRDMKILNDKGYDVMGLDSSLPLVEIAKEYSGCSVDHKNFHEIDYIDKFDGVLAIASLLHVPELEITSVFEKIFKALKKSGVFFVSFQYGEKQRLDDKGRLFTDMTESKLTQFLKTKNYQFDIIEIYKNQHSFRENDYWLLALLRK